MVAAGANDRFLSTTRGRIILLIRRAARTIDELATVLGITDNAVRAQILALERDRLIRQHGTRRGQGKPAHLYELTPEAEELFPKPFAPLLCELLEVLAERLPSDVLTAAMVETGRRMAAGRSVTGSASPALVAAAAALLEEMGGVVEVRTTDSKVLLDVRNCPLALVVARRPEVCTLVEALLASVVNVPVQKRCVVGEQPHCSFEIGIHDGLRRSGARKRRGGGFS